MIVLYRIDGALYRSEIRDAISWAWEELSRLARKAPTAKEEQ